MGRGVEESLDEREVVRWKGERREKLELNEKRNLRAIEREVAF